MKNRTALDGPPQPSNYYEHDNRLGPDYDDFGDEYNDDYNRLNRPPNYSRYENNNSTMSSNYSNQSFYSSSSSSSSTNNFQNGNNQFNNRNNNNFNPFVAAQAILSQVAPIFNNPNLMPNNNFNNNNNNINKPNMNNLNNNIVNNNMNNSNITETQPQMLTFKQFLSQLNTEMNGNVSNEIANKRYNDYKIQFRKDQVQAFFDAHKHEEWFKCRYHPEESTKRKEEQRESIKKRLELFLSMLAKLDKNEDNYKLSLEITDDMSRNNLNRFLEACMIKLEDGSDEDVQKLEAYYDKIKNKINQNEIKEVKLDKIDEKEENEDGQEDAEEGEEDKKNIEKKLNNSEATEETKQVEETVVKENESSLKQDIKEDIDFIQTLPHKTQSIFFKHLPVIVTRQDLEKIGCKYEGFKRASISEPAPERRFQRRGWITFSGSSNIKDLCSKINGTRLYEMQLNAAINRETDQKVKCISGLANHRDIVRNDLKLICKVVDNMDKRWGLWNHKFVLNQPKTDEISEKKDDNTTETDLDVEKQTNESSTNNGTKSDDNETNSNKNPLLLEALSYLEHLDEIIKLEKSTVSEEPIEKQEQQQQDEISSTKPEETSTKTIENDKEEIKKENEEDDESKTTAASGEEVVTTTVEDDLTKDEKLSIKNENEETKKSPEKPKIVSTTGANRIVKLEKDEKASSLLDRLILYLRLVHSIDYYNATEYQQEDFMPSRCGILHVRGSSQVKNNSSIVNIINGVNVNYYDPVSIKKLQIDEWNRLFDIHIKSYSDYRDRVDLETAKRLGMKEVNAEIEKFINSNCQQIDKNIWLCPLSGKKFKGPDYVKKHIETKHAERLLEVEKEVDYFNRFVMDPKRPYLPEHPFSKNNQQNQMMMQQNNYPINQYGGAGYHHGPFPGYNDHHQNNRFPPYHNKNNNSYPNQMYNQPYPNKNYNMMQASHYPNDNYYNNYPNQGRGGGYHHDQPHFNHHPKISKR